MEEPASRLNRRLGLTDAVAVGLGAMIGAGVFSAFGPAAAVAGTGLLPALLLAAAVAWANATSSAWLAVAHPESGGAYAWGRYRLGPGWGFLAGWAFVSGKLASCAAMALTFGVYAVPRAPRLGAVGAIALLLALNLGGVQRTAAATKILVAAVLGSLAIATGGALAAAPGLARLDGPWSLPGILQAAALLFFAFAGYARVAVLGEEVKDPARTIPRAIPISLAITLLVYATVAVAALAALGPEAMAASPTPLADAAARGWPWAGPVVRAGAAVACVSVLLSLLAGLGRTVFAMAAAGDLPRPLAAVHPRTRVPHVAELGTALVVAAAVLVADLRGAIGWSSFCVLLYYGVAHLAALRRQPGERRWRRPVAGAGLAACVALALSLGTTTVLAGTAVLAAGVFGRRLLR